jgi:hypothetical protein
MTGLGARAACLPQEKLDNDEKDEQSQKRPDQRKRGVHPREHYRDGRPADGETLLDEGCGFAPPDARQVTGACASHAQRVAFQCFDVGTNRL